MENLDFITVKSEKVTFFKSNNYRPLPSGLHIKTILGQVYNKISPQHTIFSSFFRVTLSMGVIQYG